MRRMTWLAASAAAATMACSSSAQEKPGFRDTPMLPDGKWRVHDPDRPYPEVVKPAPPGAPPSDAVVLFAGTSLEACLLYTSPSPRD